jgi:NADPH2:quinone reductase
VRAVLIREHGDPRSLDVEDIPTPHYAAHEVLVDVHAAGVNFPDALVIEGKYQILPPRPFVPGKDAAGIVGSIGSSVQRVKPGDRVLVSQEHGCYAEQIVARDSDCHVIPDAMSFIEAAAMGLTYQTAYFALIDRAQVRTGETVLILGAGGGVGLAAVQIAKALGAQVLAGVRHAEHAALAKANGADHIIDLSHTDLRQALREQVHAVTNGKGADIVLDPVGGDVFDASLRALAWCGRIVVIGFAAGRIPEIKASYLLLKNIAVYGLQWSDYRERTPERVAAVQRELFTLYRAGSIKPHVMRTFALEQFAEALELVKRGGVHGKVVLTLNPHTDQT